MYWSAYVDWFLVGVCIAQQIALGIIIYQLWQDRKANKAASSEDRTLLRELLGNIKSWIISNEMQARDAVETVKQVTDEQTKTIKESVREATAAVAESVAASKPHIT